MKLTLPNDLADQVLDLIKLALLLLASYLWRQHVAKRRRTLQGSGSLEARGTLAGRGVLIQAVPATATASAAPPTVTATALGGQRPPQPSRGVASVRATAAGGHDPERS